MLVMIVLVLCSLDTRCSAVAALLRLACSIGAVQLRREERELAAVNKRGGVSVVGTDEDMRCQSVTLHPNSTNYTCQMHSPVF